jgi:hypothetical protein
MIGAGTAHAGIFGPIDGIIFEISTMVQKV